MPWVYKACDWDLVHHECGPDGATAVFLDETAAFGWLFQHGVFACGIESNAPTAQWTQGVGFVAPTGIPVAPFQEDHLRPYQFVAKKQPPLSEPQDCSASQVHAAMLYRYRTLECPRVWPDGTPLTDPAEQGPYNKVGPDANGQYICYNNASGEITRANNAVDHEYKCFEGNPCNPATGAKIETTLDYSAPGIEFSRTFRSTMVPWANASTSKRRLPPHWTHSYVRVLRLDGAGSAPNELFRPDGTSVPVTALAGQTDVYVAADASGTQVRPGVGIDEWDVFFATGGIEHYDSVTCVSADGDITRPRLAYLEDSSNNRTSVYYADDCADHPNQIVGPFGHSISITIAAYDPDAPTFIEKVTDSAGQDIVYGYSAGNTGKLLSVTYQNGEALQYHYEDTQPGNENLLTGVTDEEAQRYSTFTYDFTGRALSTEHAGGTYKFTFDYDSTSSGSTQNTIVTDANGNQKTYRLLSGGPARPWSINRPQGSTRQYFESNSGQFRLTRSIDEKSVTTKHVYDDFHETQLIEVDGKTEERITDYQYLNDTGDLRTRTIRPSVCNDGTTRFAEDELVYLAGSQNVSQIISRGYRMNSGTCDAIDQIVTFSNHNAAGQPGLIDGPRTGVSDTLTIDYYECIIGGSCGQIESITNALGHVTTFDSYDSHGRLLQSTDANGLATGYAYDLRGRLTSIAEMPTTGSARVTSFTYEARDLIKTATLPNGLVLSYDYDAAHRLQSITDHLGNHIDYGYDLHGNRIDEDVFDSSNALKRVVDYTFDASHRLIVINSGGFATNYKYNSTGTLNRITDANSALTLHSYDRFYRLTYMRDAKNGQTFLTYDVADNLVSVKSPINDITSYVYDDLGNLLSENSPDRGLLSYSYDDAGNRTSEVNANGKVTGHSYDALNRLVLTTLDGGQTIAYNYDLNANGTGRLSNTVDASGSTAWLYDNFGAVTQKQQIIGAVSLTTNYAYDSLGRMQSMTLPSGKVVTYGYNDHLATSVTIDGSLLLSGASYDPFGAVSGWTWGDLSVSSRVFDTRGSMTSHTLASDTRTLGYDPVGQITAIDDTRNDLDMSYDVIGRVKTFASTPIPGGAALPGSQVFTYDRNSNRTALNEDGSNTSYTIESSSNRLLRRTGPSPKTYSYDAAGNIVGDGTHTFAYDDRERLVDVDLGAVVYQHNALGQRVVKNNGTSTLFSYGESGELIGEYDATGTPIQETVYFNGAPVSVLQGSNVYEVHTDHLGTPRAISDTGTVIWRWESDPFGSTAATEDPDGNGIGFTYNFRFPGQYYDQETGLHYNYYRTYDPSTGRYLESDPIGLAAGPNTYSYVSNMPTMRTDNYGLAEWDVVGSGSIGAVAGIGGKGEWYTLESKCDANGNKYRINVLASGASAGAGLKCNYCWMAPGDVGLVGGGGTFDDHSPNPNPDAFNGSYLSVKAGIKLFGFGGDYGDTVLGTATSLRQFTPAASFGTFEAELAGTIGASTVQSIETIPCDCEVQ